MTKAEAKIAGGFNWGWLLLGQSLTMGRREVPFNQTRETTCAQLFIGGGLLLCRAPMASMSTQICKGHPASITLIVNCV